MGDYKRVLMLREKGWRGGSLNWRAARARWSLLQGEVEGSEVNSGRWAFLCRSPSPSAEEFSEGG